MLQVLQATTHCTDVMMGALLHTIRSDDIPFFARTPSPSPFHSGVLAKWCARSKVQSYTKGAQNVMTTPQMSCVR